MLVIGLFWWQLDHYVVSGYISFYFHLNLFQTQHQLLLEKKNHCHEVSHSDETVCDGHASDWTAPVFDCSSFCPVYRMDSPCIGKTCNSNPWLGLVPKQRSVTNLPGSWKALDQRQLPNPWGTQESSSLVCILAFLLTRGFSQETLWLSPPPGPYPVWRAANDPSPVILRAPSFICINVSHSRMSFKISLTFQVGSWTILSRTVSNWSSWIATSKRAQRVLVSLEILALLFSKRSMHSLKSAMKEVGATSRSNRRFKSFLTSNKTTFAWLMLVSYSRLAYQTTNGMDHEYPYHREPWQANEHYHHELKHTKRRKQLPPLPCSPRQTSYPSSNVPNQLVARSKLVHCWIMVWEIVFINTIENVQCQHCLLVKGGQTQRCAWIGITRIRDRVQCCLYNLDNVSHGSRLIEGSMLGILNDVPHALLEEFGRKRSSVLGGTQFVLNVLHKEKDELFSRWDTEVLKQCIHHGWEIMHGGIWREELNNDVKTIETWRFFRANVTLHFLIRHNRSERLSGHG